MSQVRLDQIGETTKLQQWLDSHRAGDPAARQELIGHACERLRTLAHRMLRGFCKLRRWEDTDDVLQNSVIRLDRALKQENPESVEGFLGLAATQIRRELIDMVRHHFGPEGAAGSHQTAGVVGGAEATDSVSPLDTAPARSSEPATLQEWTDFHENAAALPGPERAVFDALWYGGLTQSEAAAALEVSTRTIKRRWRSARYRLYQAMHGEMPG